MSSLVSYDQPSNFSKILITQTGTTYLEMLCTLAESLTYHHVRKVYNPNTFHFYLPAFSPSISQQLLTRVTI